MALKLQDASHTIMQAGPRTREAVRIACWLTAALFALRGIQGFYEDTWIPDTAVTAVVVALVLAAATQDMWTDLHRDLSPQPDTTQQPR